ncbi:hypothetical protein TNCV_1811951 [Trichonephila clavipes]|uniref:WAP domain-containing protein n=1 Tax=Trichonephila clavipes TaxID=2585209 RepID=A0A8X6W7C0_TRICX|nr:hypothetical protein TNCV_1811951 [Trichonephila clavipes]
MTFQAQVSSSLLDQGKNVCPATYSNLCPKGRKVECCSSSECPSKKVCCLYHCEVKCMKPIDGTAKEVDADKEECEKLKDGDKPPKE